MVNTEMMGVQFQWFMKTFHTFRIISFTMHCDKFDNFFYNTLFTIEFYLVFVLKHVRPINLKNLLARPKMYLCPELKMGP